MTKFAIDIFAEAADRFAAAQAEVLQEWQPSCECDAPGLRPACLTCSDCHQLRLLTQLKLSITPETVFPVALPPRVIFPHPLEVREKALEMYAQGYPLSKIQAETGVGDRHTIRAWARESNMPPRLVGYPAKIRENCLRLYQMGKKPRTIEELTSVPADTIRRWAHDAGIVRNPGYSAETKTRCLSLYQQGNTPKEIEALTRVFPHTIQRWAAAAGISRGSGSRYKHSESVRNHCLLLRREGKDYREIEVLTGISEGTVRGWFKKQ